MKKIFTLLLILVLSASGLNAQGYRMINRNSEYFFTASSFMPGVVFGLKCDSVNGVAADTTYYPYRTLKQVAPAFTPCNMDPDYPIWAGKEITITNGNHHRWQTISGDSVNINSQTPVGDTQTVFTYANTDRIVAIHSSNTLLSFANISDSVENYTLAVLDAANNIVPGFWNGKQIIISKTNGVVEMPAILDFPADTSVFTRVAAKRLTYGDCYPWQAGDELHERYYSASMQYPWYIQETTNKFILSRTMINPDTVQFTIRRVRQYIANGPPQNYLTIDTITFTVGNLTHYIEQKMPQQTIDSVYTYDLYYSPFYCGKLLMVDHVMSGAYLDQGCVSLNDFEPMLFDNYYLEGVAGYYYHDFPDANYTSNIDFMVQYYDINSVSCGTPIYVGLEENTPSTQFKSWPNPANDRLYIELPASFTGTLSVYDLSGKEITTMRMDGNNTVDVSRLANGYYIAKLRSEDGKINGNTRFVKTE